MTVGLAKVVPIDRQPLLVHGLLSAGPSIVRAALRRGVDLPLVRDIIGQPPLLVAVRRGCNASVVALLSAGSEPNERGEGGVSALHIASGHGSVQIAGSLLALGAAVDTRDVDGYTPLHRAARDGHVAVVDLLLLHGADPSAQGAGGMTPLHIAACEGRAEVVQRLAGHLGDDACEALRKRAYRQTGIGPLGEPMYEDHDVLMCAEWSCSRQTADVIRELRLRFRVQERRAREPALCG